MQDETRASELANHNKFCAKCGAAVTGSKFCAKCGKFSMPGASDEVDLSSFTAVQLAAVKKDLEQRLARFQRAFFERHGRNPNEQERAPAKPAIERYRAVCAELAERRDKGDPKSSGSGLGTTDRDRACCP